MASYNVTINLGSGDDGHRREEAYRIAAEKANMGLGKWVRSVLDPAAKLTSQQKELKSHPASDKH